MTKKSSKNRRYFIFPIAIIISQACIFVTCELILTWIKYVALAICFMFQLIVVCIEATIIMEKNKHKRENPKNNPKNNPPQNPIPPTEEEWRDLLKIVTNTTVATEEETEKETEEEEKSKKLVVIHLPKGAKIKNHKPLPDWVEVVDEEE